MTDGVAEEHLCRDEAATRRLGAELARRLGPKDTVLLFGDLGSGKTVFARGLAEGLGADAGEVSSPTFALVHEYGPAGRPPLLVHADFYRLAETERIADLGLDQERAAPLAIEWPRPPYTERTAWRVLIREDRDGSRRIRIEGPGSD